jgi:hypothetical protein
MTAPEDDADGDRFLDDEADEEFEALSCGLRRDGTCALAGTEHCDWSCNRSGRAAHNVRYRRKTLSLT